MNCESIEDCLLDYIEGQLDPPEMEEIRAHISSCPSCRVAHRDTKELVGALHVAKEQQERVIRASGSLSTTARSTLAVSTWAAGSRLGDFEIIELIGRGGMGTVYCARQLSLGRVVALKVLPAGFSDSKEALIRFRREAQAAAKLHHTNIVPVYAQGEFDGHLYYAMEKIDGVDLGRIIKSDPARIYSEPQLLPSVAVEEALEAADEADPAASSGVQRIRGRAAYSRLARLLAQVADALGHAHSHHVLHRDVKPQNLLLGRDGQLHITDFGLARMLDEPGMTLTGEIIGTPAYMSPEQIDADQQGVDHRTDIYSLGVTLYELLTGQRPFDGPTREQTIARIRQREPKPPRKLNPNIPIDLETICLRAIEKEPHRRYQTAGDMACDLLRYADDRPILSRRVGPIEKAIKWIRRHPAMTTIIVLSVLIVAGGYAWRVQVNRERREQAAILVDKAIERLTLQDYRDSSSASALLAKASSLGPDPARYHFALGFSQLLGDSSRSIENLQIAQKLDPANVEIMYVLAFACRYDQRIDDYQKWMAAADAAGGAKSAEAHFYRGLALLRLDPKAAAVDLNTATNLKDNFYQAMLHLGRALNTRMYHERKVETFDTIKEKLGAACQLNQQEAYPRYLLSIAYRIAAEIYDRAGDREESETNYARALKLALEAQDKEPKSPRGFVCEAEYWESRGEFEKALVARDRGWRFCDKTATQAETLEYRWRLCFWMGDGARAAADLQSLLKVAAPTDPKFLWVKYAFPALVEADAGRLESAVNMASVPASERPADFRAVTTSAMMLCLLGRPASAVQLLDSRREGVDFRAAASVDRPESWYRSLYDYLSGRIEWSALDARAEEILAATPEVRRDPKLLWVEAHLFAGAKALGAGNRSAAAESFDACERMYDYDDYSYFGCLLGRKMKRDSRWPEWIPTPPRQPEVAGEPPPEANH